MIKKKNRNKTPVIKADPYSTMKPRIQRNEASCYQRSMASNKDDNK